jgi:GGDEF domain-containing protein
LLRNYRKDGSQFWNELRISPVKDAAGAVTTHFVSVINDVSERVNYQKELEYQATHDSLTGLANRNLLNDRISQAIAWAKRQNLHVGLLLLDLDHFKLINDASGHGAGDEMLKQVAQRLNMCVRDTDTVARLGGDEFVIVLTDLPESGDVDVISEKSCSPYPGPCTSMAAKFLSPPVSAYRCIHAMAIMVKFCCVMRILRCTASKNTGATACVSLFPKWASPRSVA